jgi:hypothetical protein
LPHFQPPGALTVAGGVGIGGALNLPNVTVATNGRISTTENVFCSFLRSTNDVGGTGNIEAEGDVIVGGVLRNSISSLYLETPVSFNPSSQSFTFPNNFKELKIFIRRLSSNAVGSTSLRILFREGSNNVTTVGGTTATITGSGNFYLANVGNGFILSNPAGSPENVDYCITVTNTNNLVSGNYMYFISGIGHTLTSGTPYNVYMQGFFFRASLIDNFFLQTTAGSFDLGAVTVMAQF